MPFVTRKSLLTLSILSGVAVVAVAGFVWSGVYNIGADDQHTRPVYALMEAMRERSIETRASKLAVPDLKDPARIAQGAGNYDAMCTGCHLAPGAAETELSKGLYPAPPDLTKNAVDAAEAFWVIKHGIKASGMPAWGKSMEDSYIWNMVAFLQQLPTLDAAQYRALVARSGGHSHGGGETGGHSHADGEATHEDAGHAHADGEHEAKATVVEPTTHVHADGKRHVHASATPTASPEPTAAPSPTAETAPDEHDEHEHQHQH
jgi:mono/diheme cytochrome c family protein